METVVYFFKLLLLYDKIWRCRPGERGVWGYSAFLESYFSELPEKRNGVNHSHGKEFPCSGKSGAVSEFWEKGVYPKRGN